MNSYAVARNNAERPCVPFIQFLPMKHLAKVSHSITLRILVRIQSRQNVSTTRTPVLPFYKHPPPQPSLPSLPLFLSSIFLELIYNSVFISAVQQSDSVTHLGLPRRH